MTDSHQLRSCPRAGIPAVITADAGNLLTHETHDRCLSAVDIQRLHAALFHQVIRQELNVHADRLIPDTSLCQKHHILPRSHHPDCRPRLGGKAVFHGLEERVVFPFPDQIRAEAPDIHGAVRNVLLGGPLIGLIPKEDRERGKREKYYCLGIYEPLTDDDGDPILDERGCQRFGFPRLSTREANNVSASQRKEKGHLLHRPCDNMWAAWMRLQGRKFPMLTETYNTYRLPFEAEQQQKQQPKFAFE